MIGVCMKYAQYNYGGMLQAQALCKELEGRKIPYELIRYEHRDSLITKIKYIPRLFNKVLMNDKKQLLNKRNAYRKYPEYTHNDHIRKAAFDRYCRDNFENLSPVFVGFDELKKGAERYNAVVVGSDQLWSPAGLPTNFFNLMFVPDSIRKISIASSFGVKNIPWYQKKRTAAYLRRIEYISMRENRGSEIVKELTGRDVPVIVDPVLLFSRQEWGEMVPLKTVYDRPYIFAYLLGNNPEQRKVIQGVADKYALDIVMLRHVDQYIPSDEQFGTIAPYNVGPDTFLNILRGAKYVFTDSFHGACFSVIHKKDFVIFDRYPNTSSVSKNSRIDSLCENLGLSARRFNGNIEEILSQTIDYEAVNERLDAMKKGTSKYLDNALAGLSEKVRKSDHEELDKT